MDGLGTLDLGDDAGLAARFFQQAAGLLDVLGAAREGYRQVIHAQLRGQLDVHPVLVGERAGREPAALAVYALVVGEHAAVLHGADDAWADDLHHPQADLTVSQHQDVTGAHVLGQILVGQAHLGLVAGVVREICIEGESLAVLEDDLLVLELLDADLGALQVTQDTHVLAHRGRGCAHQVHALLVVAGFTVGEIEAHHVHAGADDGLHHFRGIGGGPEGRDYFCSAWHAVIMLQPRLSRRAVAYACLRELIGEVVLPARSSSMATAGSFLPSRNSRNAPPPVDT